MIVSLPNILNNSPSQHKNSDVKVSFDMLSVSFCSPGSAILNDGNIKYHHSQIVL